MKKIKKEDKTLKSLLLTKMNFGRKIVIAYSAIFAVLIGVVIFLVFQINSINALYAVHSTYINESGLCSPANKTTMLLFYASSSSCPSCSVEYKAFINDTTLLGIWSNDTQGSIFVGPFCAYAVNLTLYNENQSAVFAPLSSISIFEEFSQDNVPFIVFGGKYSKIGGFSNQKVADEQILNYICLSINNSLPQCG